jgi:hypothetical protein
MTCSRLTVALSFIQIRLWGNMSTKNNTALYLVEIANSNRVKASGRKQEGADVRAMRGGRLKRMLLGWRPPGWRGGRADEGEGLGEPW